MCLLASILSCLLYFLVYVGIHMRTEKLCFGVEYLKTGANPTTSKFTYNYNASVVVC
jgi:hypothetical protein